MKIIISHDVDQLYATDHLLKDLILEKLWVRSLQHMCQGKINFSTFWYRLTLLFHNRTHRIDELMVFDKAHGIPSIFFFGMANGLGMSYSREKAAPIIRRVLDAGFDIGVHGIDFQNQEKIQNEHDAFQKLTGITSFGLRNHYVRFDNKTFEYMANAGYLFDSTWFNKQSLEFRAPYRINNMWEFPLHIMDSYICPPGKLKEGKKNTAAAILQAKELGMPYCTILFHDPGFDEQLYPELRQWYEWTVHFCEENGYSFISYQDAIQELEGKSE